MNDFSGPVDISKRLGLNQPTIDYEKLVKSLNDTIAQKEETIKTLHSENSLLKSEIHEYKKALSNPSENTQSKEQLNSYREKLDTYSGMISQKDEEISQLQEKLQVYASASNNGTTGVENDLMSPELINSYKIKIGEYFQTITEKENEIADLKNKLSELSSNHSQDESYRSLCEELKKELEASKTRINNQMSELSELKNELASKKGPEPSIGSSNRDNSKDIFPEANNSQPNSFEVLDNTNDTLFTASQVSNYLINTVKAFDKQADLLDSQVNYIIDSINVEFNAKLSKTGTDEIVIYTPDTDSTNVTPHTNIKISIKSFSKGI